MRSSVNYVLVWLGFILRGTNAYYNPNTILIIVKVIPPTNGILEYFISCYN